LKEYTTILSKIFVFEQTNKVNDPWGAVIPVKGRLLLVGIVGLPPSSFVFSAEGGVPTLPIYS
jgi:hypothetical protein